MFWQSRGILIGCQGSQVQVTFVFLRLVLEKNVSPKILKKKPTKNTFLINLCDKYICRK